MARAEKNSDFRDLRDAAVTQGWIVEHTERGHWKFTPPDKSARPCFFSGSPGDWRGILNFVAQLRRCGFQPPKRNKR